MQRYGLIGKKLGHSFSKEIHEMIEDYTYELMEMDEKQVDEFLRSKNFRGLNITIPYKKLVIPYLDKIDKKALSIGSVNTIVNRNGKLYGFNTDYDGFDYMVRHHKIQLQNKRVLVIGNGGAAAAIKAVCRDHKVKDLYCVSRHPKGDALSYQEVYEKHTDIEVLINTSPVGMYPQVDQSPVDLDDFPDLNAVLDVVYNPLCTKLGLQAKQKGLPFVPGLEMLVVQAIRAKEHFLDQPQNDEQIQGVLAHLLNQRLNIVLIGMPSCGKTTIGQLIANRMKKEFIDIDEEITKQTKKTIPEIFEKNGETGFRDIETEITKKISISTNKVISCGGGIILRKENMDAIAQNGWIVFIDRPLEDLVGKDPDRPLCSSKEAVQTLYKNRYSLYTTFADIVIKNDSDISSCIEKIYKEYIRYINNEKE